MRRALLALILAAVVVLGVQRLYVALASEPTRIRWRIEQMVEGFNATRPGACLRGVADDWRDEGSELDRALLGEVLRALFFQEKDPRSGRFRYRVEVEIDTIKVEGEREAQADLVARFDLLEDRSWSPTWKLRVRARLAKHGELGWQAVRTSHETLESDGRFAGAR